jgi:hypothetical protein
MAAPIRRVTTELTSLPKPLRPRQILLDFFLVFLFTVVLIRPYFKMKYTDKWGSIESTFIADARFLSDHWPHAQWQPLWYAGTRFDYIYPPALRYGTAAISKLTRFWPVKAYHFYTALFYAIGIAGVYLLMRIGTGSRGSAYLAAISTALMSPIFLFMPQFRADALQMHPQRLGVLVRYGEGPHMSALALIPIALAFTWLALEKPRPWAIAAAALASAGVVSNNFYGATALATFYPILVWSFWITRKDRRIFLPSCAIPVLAYGLTAFWLVPSYFRVTAHNMRYVSHNGTAWSAWVAVAVAAAFVAATVWLARAKPGRTWEVFLAGSVVFFTLNVLGNHYFNFRVTGEPGRLLPELDMIYIMMIVYLLRWMWNRPPMVWRGAAIVLVAAAFGTTQEYLSKAWEIVPPWPDHTNRVEYRISDWLWKNMPDARVCPTGSVRFWFDTWHDLAQVGGGSEQGLINSQVLTAQWETNAGTDPRPATLWMQAMGVDVIYVADKQSQEIYKDARHPHKFDGVLPVLFDDKQGNVLYRVPRRWPDRIRVVETAKLNAIPQAQFPGDTGFLEPYATAIENGPASPATLRRAGTDAMRGHARLAPGQSIVVQETYDPAWHAWSAGVPLTVRKDAMDMMIVDVPPGDHDLTLAFLTPLENKVGRVLTLLTLAAILALFWIGLRRERSA